MSRYIDADAVVWEIEKDKCGLEDYDSALDVAIAEIKTFKTADVVDRNECTKCVLYPFKQLRERLEANMVEVVHGEWVLNDDQVYECKDCGYVPSFDGYTYFNYCPNCGAKMDLQ